MTTTWKCKYCGTTANRATPRSAFCDDHACFHLHVAARKSKDRQWREVYKTTPAYDAQQKRRKQHRIDTDYAADKRYARTEQAKMLKKARRDTKRKYCTWNPDEGCIFTDQHIGKRFQDAKDSLECDHFLPLALLKEHNLLEVATSAINLVWIDTRTNRAKRSSIPHHFAKMQRSSQAKINQLRTRVFIVLRALLNLANIPTPNRAPIYQAFDVSELGQALDND